MDRLFFILTHAIVNILVLLGFGMVFLCLLPVTVGDAIAAWIDDRKNNRPRL